MFELFQLIFGPSKMLEPRGNEYTNPNMDITLTDTKQ
jgi:hypothetical protein